MRCAIADPGAGMGLSVDYFPLYSYAACHAGLAPVRGIEPPEDGPISFPTGELEIRLPGIGYERTIPPGDAAEVSRALGVPLDRKVANLLEGISRRMTSHLLFVLGGKEIARIPVSILPVREWSHSPESRKLAAAHVLPGDDVVSRTVADAAPASRSGNGAWSLPELVRQESEESIPEALRAVYVHLAADREIRYEEPRVELDPWSGASYQTIRAPHEVAGDSPSRRGAANCLDLTVFLAGCLESLGLHPLILFTGARDEAPRHALLGCWADRGRRFRPLLADPAALRRHVERGDLLVVEATGICAGERRLAFDDARRAARDHLERCDHVHALDISATRPPHGDVGPLGLANAPVVQRAFWAGEELRERLGAPPRETLHVLYGLCATEGELTRGLLQATGGSTRRVRRIIEASLAPEDHEGPGRETNSYRVCLETARLNARNRDSRTVEETDLLWAVLDSPSRNVRKVLETAGCDFPALLAELARQHRRPRWATVSRAFDPASTPGG